MSYLKITGGRPLGGTIEVQGSKNAVLPVLTACLLGETVCVIENCPEIGDVEDCLTILRQLGCKIRKDWQKHRVVIDASRANGCNVGGIWARRIRSSILFLGAILGKQKQVEMNLPGGCAIGTRPIDLHLSALERLGAIFEPLCCLRAHCSPNGLHGGEIAFTFPSVGATENAILAAAQAEGETLIRNAAQEPEVDELCEFLRMRGVWIHRRPDGAIHIRGIKKESFLPVTYRIHGDRIVAGTYLIAAAATGGWIKLKGILPEELESPLQILRQMGLQIHKYESGIWLEAVGTLKAVRQITTSPYPGFPTDLQSPMMALLCRASGESCMEERIFDKRFETAGELKKMGAKIAVCSQCARIEGTGHLHPADMTVPDLRGGAALVIAALGTPGESRISQIHYIERGYEDICRDLRQIGADIQYIPGNIPA